MPGHEVFRKDLASFEARRGGVGSNDWQASLKKIDDPGVNGASGPTNVRSIFSSQQTRPSREIVQQSC